MGGPRRRDGFALTGRSAVLDPLHDAVRPDLADVRLADRVFAPHYAACLPRVVTRHTALRAAPTGGDTLAQLPADSRFELLDVTGRNAWGVAVDSGLVGYLDADVLGHAA